MSLFDAIFKHRPKERGTYNGSYQMLNGYTPHFSMWSGNLYESELVRAAINTRATHISKLDVTFQGSARPALQRKLKAAPNQFQTWSQFLARLSTILDVHNTAFICPVFDEYGEVSGIYAPLPDRYETVDFGGVPYLRMFFDKGKTVAIELSACAIMTRMQYKSDLFGESNNALLPTMDLINIQNQGIEEGVKSAASYRFMARVGNFSFVDDLADERKRFMEQNFGREANAGGILLFPNTYQDVKQIEAKPFIADAETMKAIRENVYDYYGVNEDILTNKFNPDTWAAFYEGVVEAFAIQFSEVLTKMLFTLREQAQGNAVAASSNRLQYMSNSDKLRVSSQMLDRGIMSLNDVRKIWNLPPVEGGDVRIIRGEYYNADEKTGEENDDETGNQSV